MRLGLWNLINASQCSAVMEWIPDQVGNDNRQSTDDKRRGRSCACPILFPLLNFPVFYFVTDILTQHID